jgi:hypothetical protein
VDVPVVYTYNEQRGEKHAGNNWTRSTVEKHFTGDETEGERLNMNGMNREDKLIERIQYHFDQLERKWQKEHPCPQCGSHNTHCEPTAISGKYSSWIEWCDDCNWTNRTSDFPKKSITQ